MRLSALSMNSVASILLLFSFPSPGATFSIFNPRLLRPGRRTSAAIFPSPTSAAVFLYASSPPTVVLRPHGVSVSPGGFFVLLRPVGFKKNTNEKPSPDTSASSSSSEKLCILPLSVTPPGRDVYSASSPAALTIIQLLTGTDVAPAGIFGPEALSVLARGIYSVTSAEAASSSRRRSNAVAMELPEGIRLKSVQIKPLPSDAMGVVPFRFIFRCSGSSMSPNRRGATTTPRVSFSLSLTQLAIDADVRSALEDVCAVRFAYGSDAEIDCLPSLLTPEKATDASAAFLAVALAMRYDAKLIMVEEDINFLWEERRRREAILKRTEMGSMKVEVTSEENGNYAGEDGDGYETNFWKRLRPIYDLTSEEVMDQPVSSSSPLVERGINLASGGSTEDDGPAEASELRRSFPSYRTMSTIQAQSEGVRGKVVKNFELAKLEGALRMARERGDTEAERKILEAMDETRRRLAGGS